MNRRKLMQESGPARTAQVRSVALLLLRGVGVVGLTGAISVGSVLGWKWIHHGERLALKNVTFLGVQRTNEDDLIRRAGLVRGQNVFSLNTAQAAAAMEQADWVAHVRVDKSYPDTVVVSVEERHPVAIVNAGPLFVVDDGGIRIKGDAAGDNLDLPVLSGLAADDFGVDEQEPSPAVISAMHVLAAYQADRMGKVAALAELHVSNDSGETVYTAFCGDDPAVEVRLGAFPTDPAKEVPPVLARMDRMWTELGREGRRARTIDLGNRKRPDWVPTRLEPQMAARLDGVH